MLRMPAADYETDFVLWAETQAAALRDRRFEELDLANLIEEVDDLSKRERDAVRSHLKQLVAHLLKFEHQPERATQSWHDTIEAEAEAIAEAFDDTPSLRGSLKESMAKAYPRARRLARKETNLPLKTFPETPTPELWRAVHAAIAGEDFKL
jgi:hypothetical protein